VLDFRENQIDSEGAMALIEALRLNRTLTLLVLGDNQIGIRNLEEIERQLDINKHLSKNFSLHVAQCSINICCN
jgi:hypothetical protein